MDVSITIVNWNAAGVLTECLRSVLATSGTLRSEVIVVDNGSDDDSAAVVSTHFPQVSLIRNTGNVGFGRAQNQALAVTRGRYIVMLNNDAIVRPETIPTLVRFMEGHPDVGACGCPDHRQTTLGTAYSGAFQRFPSLSRTVVENLWALLRPPGSWDLRWLAVPVHRWMGEVLPAADASLEVAWVVGALLCIRKEVLEQIGGFDEGFFLFDEDIDLCRRIGAAGWKVAFTTGTSYMHRGGFSSAGRKEIERIRSDSRALYFRKYHGRTTAALSRIQHYALRTSLLSWRRRLGSLLRSASRKQARDRRLIRHRDPATKNDRSRN